MLPAQTLTNTLEKNFHTEEKEIKSFGLILFHCPKSNALKKSNDGVSSDSNDFHIEVLVQERRDTFEYVEFLQGLWSDAERVKFLFSRMTYQELQRIYHHPFVELWNDLWIDKNTKIYRDGFTRAKKKYDEISHNIKDFVKLSVGSALLPWGFPKGRKHSYSEKDIECAIRETEEESRVPRNLFKILPFKYVEKFTGSNGVHYSTQYSLCEVKEKYVPPRIQTADSCIRTSSISEEVNDVRWVSYSDACKLLNTQRQSILYEAYGAIKTYITSKETHQ